jgi:hypothetical protein
LRNRKKRVSPGHPGSDSAWQIATLGGVIRVVAGVAFTLGRLGLTGLVLALLLAEAAMFLIEARMHRTLSRAHAMPADPRSLPPPSASGVLIMVAFAVLAHTDLLFARYFLARGAGEEYAKAAVVARPLLFVPLMVGLVLTARATRSRTNDPFRWLGEWLAAAATLTLTLASALAIFGEPILGALVGLDASPPVTAFPLIGTGVGFLALVWQLAYFHWAVDSRAHLLVSFGILAEVLVVAFGVSEARIAGAQLIAAMLTALLLYQGAWAITRWSPPLTLLRPHEELIPADTGQHRYDAIELSIIVQCHNAGPQLREFLRRLQAELSKGESSEIVVVSDGSTDDTLLIASEFSSPTLRVLHYPERAGKGHALRLGLTKARGHYVGFIDSDGDIDPQAIGSFVSLMKLYEPEIVLGSKRHPLSLVEYPPLRRAMSWLYHKLTRILFRVNVRDTQTGLKVIRRDVLASVLPRMFEKRFAWDLELLVVAKMLGFTRVFEAPVRIDYRFSSQVNPKAVLRIVSDTAAIFYRRYILNSYRHTVHRLAVIREGERD